MKNIIETCETANGIKEILNDPQKGSRRLKEVALTAAILRERLLPLARVLENERLLKQYIRANIPAAVKMASKLCGINYSSVHTKFARELSGSEDFMEGIFIFLRDGDIVPLKRFVSSGLQPNKGDSHWRFEWLLSRFSEALDGYFTSGDGAVAYWQKNNLTPIPELW